MKESRYANCEITLEGLMDITSQRPSRQSESPAPAQSPTYPGPGTDAPSHEKAKRGVTTSRDVRLMVMGALVCGVPNGRIRDVFQLTERQIRYIRDRGVDPQHHKSGRRKKARTPPPETGPKFEGLTVGNSEVFTRPLTKNPHIVYDRRPPPPNAQIFASDPSAESPWKNSGLQEGPPSYARLLTEDPKAFVKAFQRDPMANAKLRSRSLNYPPSYRPAPWDQSLYINAVSGTPQVYNGQLTANAPVHYNGQAAQNPQTPPPISATSQAYTGYSAANPQTPQIFTEQPPANPHANNDLPTANPENPQTPQASTGQTPANPHADNHPPTANPQILQASTGQAPTTPEIYHRQQLSGTPRNPLAFTGPPHGSPQAYHRHPSGSPGMPRQFIIPGTGVFSRAPLTTPQAFNMPVQGHPQQQAQPSTGFPRVGQSLLPAPGPQRPQAHVWIAGIVLGRKKEESSEDSEDLETHQLSDEDSDEESMDDSGDDSD